MSWLSKVVRPKLRELVGKPREIPENLWHQCPSCGQTIFHRDLTENALVCHHCGYHQRMDARARLASLLDPQFRLLDLPRPTADPLRFRDVRRYTDRLKDAQTLTGSSDALLIAAGTMDGLPVVCAVLEFAFMGGSMGAAVGEGLIAASKCAVAEKATLIVVTASGGARMQEGILSLMQMARTTIAIGEVKDAGLPYLVVLTDPTTGGVSASFAMLGDITIAEPGAVIGFAGARVIEQTIRESLPEGFQKAEYLLEHGMIDMVVPRRALRQMLVRIIRLLRPLPTEAGGDGGDRPDPTAIDFSEQPEPLKRSSPSV